MRIHVLNPNTSAWMTGQIGRAARQAASQGTVVACTQLPDGPETIETAADAERAAPHIRAEVEAAARSGCDAHVIACFDDPSVPLLRRLVSTPVLGIGQASMMAASLVGPSFGIVTTSRESIPELEDMARRYGYGASCRSVRSCDVEIADLNSPEVYPLIREAADACLSDGAEILLLGCAGLAETAARLQAETGAPVIEGVAAATRIVEWLIHARVG